MTTTLSLEREGQGRTRLCFDRDTLREVPREQVVSIASTQTAVSSNSAALVELNLSAISLPSAIGGATGPFPPNHDGVGQQEVKPYRDVVTTHVYTVPPCEGVPVRLTNPRRPSTGRLHGRAPRVRGDRARSAHVSRQLSITTSTTRRRHQRTGRRFTTRAAKSAPATRRLDPTKSKAAELAATYHAKGIGSGGIRSSDVDENSRDHPRRAPHTAPGSTGWRGSHGKCPTAAFMQAESLREWKDQDPRPPVKPRALSAPARGLAIRRAVEGCCKNLPETPEFVRGAKRFLRQWDSASRIQRGHVLRALANNLLVDGPRQQSAQPSSVSDDADNFGDTEWRGNGQDFPCEPQAASEIDRTSLGLAGFHPLMSGAGDLAHELFYTFSNKQGRFPRNKHQAEATADIDGAIGTTDHVCNQRGAASATTGVPAGFLNLLGPYAGLLAMRIFLHLKILHARGYALGPCFRVATLLAESTEKSTRDDDGGSGSLALSLVRQLLTSGVIHIALEVVAAEPEKERRQRTARPSSLPEEENDQAEALRLLLAIVRAGGRRLKECLTCSSPFPGTSDKFGNALDPTVIALRRSGCEVDTQTAGERLLVELGTGNPSGSGNVWNVVLCLLGHGEAIHAQILGCHIALKLLGQLRVGYTTSNRNPLLNQQGLLQPELVLVPAVLSLTLRECIDVRKAAEELALCLATFSAPCSYVLVAGLVGLLGIVSDVERGAPVSWIQHQNLSKWRTRISCFEDNAPTTNWDRSEACEKNKAYTLQDHSSFCDVDCALSSSREPRHAKSTPRSNAKHANGGGAGGGGSETTDLPHFPAESPAQAAIDDHATHAVALLQRICEGGGWYVCESLAYALAPLAVLDLIVGWAPAAESLPDTDESDRAGRSTFVTQGAVKIRNRGSAMGGDIQDDEMRAREGRGRGHDWQRCMALPVRHNTQGKLLHDDQGFPTRRVAMPPVALCRVVAEALLAMYCRGATGFVPRAKSKEWPVSNTHSQRKNNYAAPVSAPKANDRTSKRQCRMDTCGDTRNLKRIIDFALDSCPMLLCSLRAGDASSLAQTFFCSCGGGSGVNSSGCGGEQAELATLRRNIITLTERLGQVRPPPAVESSVLGRDHHPDACNDDHADVCAFNTEGELLPESDRCDAHGHLALGHEGGSNDYRPTVDGAPQVLGLPGNLAENFDADNFHYTTAPESYIIEGPLATIAPSTPPAAKELLHIERWRRNRRSLTTPPPAVLRRKRPRCQANVIAATGCQGKRATALAGEGPRLWGPDDWGHDAPTMAMLTQPGSRQQKPPKRRNEGRGGPVWRSVFGGGYATPPASAKGKTSLKSNENSKSGRTNDSNAVFVENKATDNTTAGTITDVAPVAADQNPSPSSTRGVGGDATIARSIGDIPPVVVPTTTSTSPPPRPAGTTTTTVTTKIVGKVDAGNGTGRNSKQHSTLPLGTINTGTSAMKQASPRFCSARRRPATASNAPVSNQPREVGKKKGVGKPRQTKRREGHVAVPSADSSLLLRLSTAPFKPHPMSSNYLYDNNDNNIVFCKREGRGEGTRRGLPDRLTAPPALRGSEIAKEAFILAEGYAISNVGGKSTRGGGVCGDGSGA